MPITPEELQRNRMRAILLSMVTLSMLIGIVFIMVRFYPETSVGTFYLVLAVYVVCVALVGLIWRATRKH